MEWFVVVPALGIIEPCGTEAEARRLSDEIYEAAGGAVGTFIAFAPWARGAAIVGVG